MPSDEVSSLPLDKLPAEWQQNDRLDVLFGPVRNKYVNSFDWENKRKFWKESIEVHCSHNKLYTFNLSRLERAFLHDRRTPACLKDVFEDLIKTGDLVPLVDFLQKPETTWSGWATSTLVKKPLSWTFNKMKSSIVTTNTANIEYVHHTVVKQEATKLLDAIPDNLLNTLLELKDFAKAMDFPQLESIKILLHQLSLEEKVAIRECCHDGKPLMLLRFNTVPKALQDIDEQIYILTKEEKILQNKVAYLENRIKELHKEAKEHLTQGNKHMARTVLRKKKLQEKSIESLEKNAHNVSSLLHNLEDTAHNHAVYKTYRMAIANLKANLEKLNIDNVDETMAQLGELVDTNNDIQSTLGQSLDASSEEDLEAELAALMEEGSNDTPNISPKPKSTRVENEEDELKFPSVPNSPSSTVGDTAKTEPA